MLFAALLAVGFTTAQAQETTTKEVFNPHWYVQGQLGGQYTTGETAFKNLLSPNGQVAVGYQFNSIWGARLNVNAWQSKGGSDLNVTVGANSVELNPRWKWNYVAPAVNVTMDVTNLIGGFNPNRLVSFGVLAGLGANIGFNNDEAAEARDMVRNHVIYGSIPVTDRPAVMSYLWDGTKTRMMGQVGANIDFKVSKRVKVGAEFNFNFLSDHYNSKNARGKLDHYYNLLAGVRVDLGKISKIETVVLPNINPNTDAVAHTVEKIVEKEVVKVVHDTVYVEKKDVREPLRRDIFFLIRGSVIDKDEMKKVDEVVAYMQKYTDAKVTVTGYADKGTGNTQLNIGYSKKRADVVANTLKKRGIAASRIIVEAKGDTDQPYEKNDMNRVTICIAE